MLARNLFGQVMPHPSPKHRCEAHFEHACCSLSTYICGLKYGQLTKGFEEDRARQLASVAQLVKALHPDRRAAGSIPARGL